MQETNPNAENMAAYQTKTTAEDKKTKQNWIQSKTTPEETQRE